MTTRFEFLSGRLDVFQSPSCALPIGPATKKGNSAPGRLRTRSPKRFILNTAEYPRQVFTQPTFEFIATSCFSIGMPICITDEIYSTSFTTAPNTSPWRHPMACAKPTIVINGPCRQNVTALQDGRVGWVAGSARTDATDSQGARFSDRWRRRSSPASRREVCPATFRQGYYDKTCWQLTRPRRNVC